MEESLDRQLRPVLKQERERLIDRKNVLEANINRISKEFQGLTQELFLDEVKPLEAYKFELRMDEYLGWVYDKHKGFRSKSGRSQNLRQWLNSTKARKWADSLFGDMLESCRQYAWEVGRCLENSSEGIEYLTNYLQCEFFIATMTGAISSGSGSGSRPLICDHSFHKRRSKMFNILSEGVYNSKKMEDQDIEKISKNKKEGNTVKNYFVELYKKWSDRYFARYIMYRTQRQNAMETKKPLNSPPRKSEIVNANTNMIVEKMEIDKKREKRPDLELDLEPKKELESGEDVLKPKYDSFDNSSKEKKDYIDADEDVSDGEDDNDIEDSSSDEPLIKNKPSEQNNIVLMLKKEKEKQNNEEFDALQKLSRDNQEMKKNMNEMEIKIRQLTTYRDLKMSSLYRQLNTLNQRANAAESKNGEYEDRIKFMNEEIISSKQKNSTLLNEMNMLRGRLEMLQSQMVHNGNVGGNWIHPNLNFQIPSTSHSSPQQIPAMTLMPTPSFPNNVTNFYLPPLIPNDESHSPSTNNNDGIYEMDNLNDFGLKRTNTGSGFGRYDWNGINNTDDFNMVLHSPIHSNNAMNMDFD